MGNNNGKILTLKEASEVSGVAIPTLRMRLKKGLIEGVKRPSKFGEVWHIKADSIKEIRNIERLRLKYEAPKKINSSLLTKKISPYQWEENPIVEAQKRHIDNLEKQVKTYEGLLTDFQARVNILESDKLHLEYKMKLLPAPVEVVTSRMPELESQVKELEAKLETEKKRSWWKKLFREK